MNLTYLICHRMPERSFFLKGYQFPVCARCTGIYIGLIFAIFFKSFINISFHSDLICFLFVFPLVLDGITQFFKLRESNNLFRLITGLMFSFSLIFI